MLRLGLLLALIALMTATMTGCDPSLGKSPSDDLTDQLDSESPPMQHLEAALQKVKSGNTKDFTDLKEALNDAFPVLQKAKESLEKDGVRQFLLNSDKKLKKKDQDQQIVETISKYYHNYEQCLMAQKILGNHSQITFEEVKNLELVLPDEECRLYLSYYSDLNVKNKSNSYDNNIELVKITSDRSRITLSLKEQLVLQMQSLVANPTRGGLIQEMAFQGLRVDLLKQELLNSHLYEGQKLSSSVSSVVHNLAPDMQKQAQRIYREDSFRLQMEPVLIKVYNTFLAKNGDKLKPVTSALMKKLFNRFTNHLGDKYADTIKANPNGIADAFADVFIDMSQKNGLKLLREKLIKSPFYLSELDPDSLAGVLKQILQENVYDVLRYFLNQTMFASKTVAENQENTKDVIEKDFSELEQYDYLNTVEDYATKQTISDSSLTSSDISEALDGLKPTDFLVSLKRYDWAKQLILNTRLFEKLREQGEFAKTHDYIPSDHKPDQVKLVSALLAISPEKELPSWTIEMIRAAAARGDKMSGAEKLKFQDFVTETPDLILEDARKVINAQEGAFEAIQKAHLRLLANKEYQWMSTDKKLEKLLSEVPIRSKSTGSSAKEVVLGILNLNKKSGLIGSEDLQTRVKKIVDGIFKDASKEALEGFEAEIELGVNYVNSQFGRRLIKAVLSDAQTRNQFLKDEVLSNPVKLGEYIRIETDTIRTQYPMLFIPVEMPSKLSIHGKSHLKDPIPFYMVISSVLRNLKRIRGDEIIGKPLMEKVSVSRLKNNATLSEDLEIPGMDLSILVGSALEEVDDDFSYWNFLKNTYIEWRIGRPITHQSQLEDWQVFFKVRDVAAAFYDKSGDPFNADSKGNPSLQTLTERMVVSALIQPYLIAARDETNSEITKLLNPSVDPEGLLKTEVMSQIAALSDGKLGGGIEQLNDEYSVWTKRAEKFKEFTSTQQDYSNRLLMLTTWVPDVSPFAHFLSSSYMLFAAMSDLGADIWLMEDYLTTYKAVQPYSNSGFLGKGLITFHDADKIREQFAMQIEGVLTRLPMDIAFLEGVALGQWIPNRKLGMYKVREFIGSGEAKIFAKNNGIDFEQYKADRDLVSEEIAQASNLGMQFGMKPKSAGIWSSAEDLETTFKKQTDLLRKERDQFLKKGGKHLTRAKGTSVEEEVRGQYVESLSQIDESLQQMLSIQAKARSGRAAFYKKYNPLIQFQTDMTMKKSLNLKIDRLVEKAKAMP